MATHIPSCIPINEKEESIEKVVNKAHETKTCFRELGKDYMSAGEQRGQLKSKIYFPQEGGKKGHLELSSHLCHTL